MESNNQTDLPKKSHKYGSVIPFIVIIILFATNPTEVQFKEFLRNDYKEQARSKDPLSQLFAGPAARLVGLTTNRTNYIFFSTFEISLPDKKNTYLGLLNHFLKIN